MVDVGAQDDGGWAIPTRTHNMPLRVMLASSETVEPDRSRPSSHLVTGIVLRAFAVHPGFRHAPATRRAGDLLKSRFFTRDRYPDQAAPSYWLRFSHPFSWTDLLSALTALTDAGFSLTIPTLLRHFLVRRQPGVQRLLEHRPQPTQGPRQRPIGRPWPCAGCSRRQRATSPEQPDPPSVASMPSSATLPLSIAASHPGAARRGLRTASRQRGRWPCRGRGERAQQLRVGWIRLLVELAGPAATSQGCRRRRRG